MLRNYLILLLLFFSASFIQAQNIEGKVLDAQSNEALSGATVKIENSFSAKISDANGFFRFLNLKKGNYTLEVSFLGYETSKLEIEIPVAKSLEIKLNRSDILTEEVIVRSSRVGTKTPVAYSNIDKETISEQNLGQDIPILLGMSPSLVTNTDAGAGVGYTGLRIRGTDISRINVTIDGIPLNDSESHSVYWVNMPDFASSLKNIQIQRGVGTSTNGAAAFGATINLQSAMPEKDFYAEANTSYGSFNTLKYNVKAGTGLLNDHYAFDVRLSQIKSDGFVDRASSDLKSAYITGGYFDEKTIIKANIILGHEKTYQAWWGVPKARLNNDKAEMQRYLDHWLYTQEEYDHMLASDSRTYNYYTYDNEVDDYKQNHYQLILSRQINSNLMLNGALFLTQGLGFYENFKAWEDFEDYGVANPVVNGTEEESTNAIQQKWLDNDFFGGNFNLNYQTKTTNLSVGSAWNQYNGDHYGIVKWAEINQTLPSGYQWYFNDGVKKDFSTYAKIEQSVGIVNLYADVQYRFIDQAMNGTHDDLRHIFNHKKYSFINPKAGLSVQLAENATAFVSFARSNREPGRRNYIDLTEGQTLPTFETLNDFETGLAVHSNNFMVNLNAFYMDYENQLLPTGKINNVGDAILTNIPESFRAGVEFSTGYSTRKFQWAFNSTLSRNKIQNFTEYVDNWDTWGQDTKELGETDIAFSPGFILKNILSAEPVKNLKISLNSQYVGKQFIDNTSSDQRMLDAYFVNDLLLNYVFELKKIKGIEIQAKINNLFNEQYLTNGWAYRYFLSDTNGTLQEYVMDGYFPQAGTNFLIGLNIKI